MLVLPVTRLRSLKSKKNAVAHLNDTPPGSRTKSISIANILGYIIDQVKECNIIREANLGSITYFS